MSSTTSTPVVLNGPELIEWLLQQSGRYYPSIFAQALPGFSVELTELSPDSWEWNLARIKEARRFKEQRSQTPFYATRAQKGGDLYWLKFAQSYGSMD